MHDVLETIIEWNAKKIPFVIATVVATWGSAPRKIGSMMVINENGEFVGSVSGGCVESAVIQESLSIINSNTPKLLDYGITNENAWDVGLACGGKIEIFCQPFSDAYMPIIDAVSNGKEISYLINTNSNNANYGEIIIDPEIKNNIESIIEDGQLEFFHNFISPPPQLIIIGGVQISQHLSSLAQIVGYSVVIIEPRKAFATKSRFPNTTIINKWPDEAFSEIDISTRTAVVALSHNPSIDDPALLSALNSSCFYIGALGSSKTQKARKARLMPFINNESVFSRIKGPAGLSIGADTPEEIAVSVLSEIIEYGHK